MTSSKKRKTTQAYFHLPLILKGLRRDAESRQNLERYEERFGSISEDMTIEDLNFYKDYLMKFDTEKAFEGLPLKRNMADATTERDCDLLQRLVFASININYKVDYDEATNSYELTLMAETNQRKLHELWFIYFGQLLSIFFNEMICMELMKDDGGEHGQWVEQQREARLKHFEQIAEQFRNQLHGKKSNMVVMPMPLNPSSDDEEQIPYRKPHHHPIIYNIFNGKGVIPLNVRSVPSWAFSQADDLVSVFIPSSVKRIGSNAFYDCKALTTVVIPPDSVRMIGTMAFGFCTSLKHITLPDSLERICEEAFFQCQSLESVAIPNGVTRIMPYTFCDCHNLKHVDIPNSVTQIGDGAFNGCVNLQSITIPDSVTRIGNRAFKQCCSLTSVEIPQSVTEISAMAFCRCENLETVVIPDSVKKIGLMAFDECLSLDRIYIRDASLLKKAYVPEGVEIVPPT